LSWWINGGHTPKQVFTTIASTAMLPLLSANTTPRRKGFGANTKRIKERKNKSFLPVLLAV
jgi:hypothetical protein